MMLPTGAKLAICHRRLFPEDHIRLFLGTVEAYADGIAKVSGFTWTRDPTHGFQRKADRRTKLISIASGSLIVYEIPVEVAIEDLEIQQSGGHSVVLTDGSKFQMDLSERL